MTATTWSSPTGRRKPVLLVTVAVAVALGGVALVWSRAGDDAMVAASAGSAPGDVVDYDGIDFLYPVGDGDPLRHNVLADIAVTQVAAWGAQHANVYAGAFANDGAIHVGFTRDHEAMLAEVRAAVDLPAEEIIAFRAAHPLEAYNAALADLAAHHDEYGAQGAPVRLRSTGFVPWRQGIGVSMEGPIVADMDAQYARLLEVVDYDELLFFDGLPAEPGAG